MADHWLQWVFQTADPDEHPEYLIAPYPLRSAAIDEYLESRLEARGG